MKQDRHPDARAPARPRGISLRGAVRRGRRGAARRLRPAVAQRVVRRRADGGERLNRAGAQAGRAAPAMAQEFSRGRRRRRTFRSNGTLDARNADVRRAGANAASPTTGSASAGWSRSPPSSRSTELRAMPARTQITRHDCVEGWSAIGKWKGVRLGPLLEHAQPKPEARYVVFHCADPMEAADGRESATTRASTSTTPPRADDPRLRAERPAAAGRQRRAAARARRAPARLQAWRSTSCASSWSRASRRSRGGKGGYWEDQGYEWYAGI